MRMTKKLLPLLISLSFLLRASCGYAWIGYVYTPEGSAVEVSVDNPELSYQELLQAENYVRQAYPNAILRGSPTARYNCHSYAWYNQAPTNNAWMNNPSPYWLDGSYQFTGRYIVNQMSLLPDIPQGDRVNYPPRYDGNVLNYPYTFYEGHITGDHSAISLGDGWAISKWGQGCVVQHPLNYCPYDHQGTYVIDSYSVPVTTYQFSGVIHSGSVNGPAIAGATVSIGGASATTNASGAFAITGIPGGSYVLTVAAAGHVTYSNSSFVIDGRQTGLHIALQTRLANLTPYTPSGWSHPLLVSKVAGSTSDNGPFSSSDPLYISWAFTNDSDTSIQRPFSIALYVDGNLKNSWSAQALQPDYHTYVRDYAIGTLTPGTHTFRVVADSSNAIPEADEADNSFELSVSILPTTYTISGTVRSGGTNGPAISGAILLIAGKTAMTDSGGGFTIGGILPGVYTLMISASGHTTFSNSAFAVAGNMSGLTFVLAGEGHVRILGSPQQYVLLQAAYGDAADGSTIQAETVVFPEDLIFSLPKSVALRGGYEPGFTARSGYTTLGGRLTIRNGRLTADLLKIR